MNNSRRLFQNAILLLLSLSLFTTYAAAQKNPSVGNLFINAYEKKDEAAMKKLIETRTKEFPAEVQAMVEYSMSPKAGKQEQDFLFGVAGLIANMYGEQTGDMRLFEAVKANYSSVLKKRKATTLDPNVVSALKKKIAALGGGDWRVNMFRLDQSGVLTVEIDVRESSGGAGFTPRIEFKKSNEARDIIKAGLPAVKKGKISWSSMGIGLKTVFIE
ncbi:MAG TPA: hypothetical protein ENI77_03745 [Nitrospirae bacterium]|nr:hypothetical protein [Nitrospirota bacterium]